jgi:hypothetical protein
VVADHEHLAAGRALAKLHLFGLAAVGALAAAG